MDAPAQSPHLFAFNTLRHNVSFPEVSSRHRSVFVPLVDKYIVGNGVWHTKLTFIPASAFAPYELLTALQPRSDLSLP
jgi:hypothetical protein